MRGLIERAPELVAAAILDGAGRPLSAVGRSDRDRDAVLAFAIGRCSLLSAPLEAGSTSLESLGYTRRRCVVGADRWWCFGAQLHDDTERTAWLFVDRTTAQGLGWACLSALLRGLRAAQPAER